MAMPPCLLPVQAPSMINVLLGSSTRLPFGKGIFEMIEPSGSVPRRVPAHSSSHRSILFQRLPRMIKPPINGPSYGYTCLPLGVAPAILNPLEELGEAQETFSSRNRFSPNIPLLVFGLVTILLLAFPFFILSRFGTFPFDTLRCRSYWQKNLLLYFYRRLAL